MISVTSSRTPALTSSSAVMIIDPVKDGTSSATAVDATSASARTRTRTNEKMFFMSACRTRRGGVTSEDVAWMNTIGSNDWIKRGK